MSTREELQMQREWLDIQEEFLDAKEHRDTDPERYAAAKKRLSEFRSYWRHIRSYMTAMAMQPVASDGDAVVEVDTISMTAAAQRADNPTARTDSKER